MTHEQNPVTPTSNGSQPAADDFQHNSAVVRQLETVAGAAPSDDLLSRLQGDLHQAVKEQAWDQGAEQTAEAVVLKPAGWWHSTSVRAAAALLTVLGAGWFISRMGVPEPAEPREALVISDSSADAESSRGTAELAHGQEISLTPAVGSDVAAQVDGSRAQAAEPGTLAEAEATQQPQHQKIFSSERQTPTDRPKPLSVPRAEQDGSTQPADGNAAPRAEPRTRRSAPYPAPVQPPRPVTTNPAGAREDQLRGQTRARLEEKKNELRSLGYLDSSDAVPAAPAPAEETIVVTSESPLLRERQLAPGAQITQTELEKIPTAREPWVELNQTPGVRVDRVNVGGTESGQATVFRDAGERTADVEADAKHKKIFSPATPAEDRERYEPPRPPRRPIAQFDAMYFRNYGISQFVDPRQDAQSTFGLEADTGSYSLVRSYLERGALPPAAAVRVEEFLNAFDYQDTAPSRGDFAITAEGALTPYAFPKVPDPRWTATDDATDRSVADRWGGQRAWLRVGVKAKEISAAERKPTALTFLIDTSGSMERENRIEVVRQSLRLLVNELERGDTVAIVTYGSRAHVLLDHTADRNAILRTIDRLRPNGSTNLQEGMEFAYRIASQRLGRDPASTNHRVLLLSDGVANVGMTDAEDLLRNVAHWASRGIELTSVGVGMGNYNDELLERLADRGDGRYAYVDGLAEARRLFVENLTGTLQTVGADARAQVTFNPDVVRRYRLVGYENRDIPDAAFRDRNTDGGEIGAGHAVTALYEVDLAPRSSRRSNLATVSLVYRPQGASELVEQTHRVRVGDANRNFASASPALRLAVLAGRFAEILRVSPYVEGDLHGLFEEAQQLVPAFPGDRKVVELTDLIGQARDLIRRH